MRGTRRKPGVIFSKHGISFEEAATVFGDPLSDTFPDPDHSFEEHRFIIIGSSESGKIIVIAHADDGELVRIISAREVTHGKENLVKKVEAEEEDDLRSEYDFSQMKGGVRGKYVERYREGTNLVLLDPDIAAVYPGAKAVNDALRLLLHEKQSPRPR